MNPYVAQPRHDDNNLLTYFYLLTIYTYIQTTISWYLEHSQACGVEPAALWTLLFPRPAVNKHNNQGSYRHKNAFFQDLRRPNSRVFQDSKILFSRTPSIHKHGLHQIKKLHIENHLSVYLHYGKEAEMREIVLLYLTV